MSDAPQAASRNTIFAAVSVIVTYAVNLLLNYIPDLPSEVRAAVLTIVLGGVMWAVTFIDRKIHTSDMESTGLAGLLTNNKVNL